MAESRAAQRHSFQVHAQLLAFRGEHRHSRHLAVTCLPASKVSVWCVLWLADLLQGFGLVNLPTTLPLASADVGLIDPRRALQVRGDPHPCLAYLSSCRCLCAVVALHASFLSSLLLVQVLDWGNFTSQGQSEVAAGLTVTGAG